MMRPAKIVELAYRRATDAPPAVGPESIEELQKAVESAPRDEMMRMRLAREYQLEGRWAEAAAEFTLCLPSRPNDPDLLCDMACCALRQSLEAHAAVLVERALALDPEHSMSLLAKEVLERAAYPQQTARGVEIGGYKERPILEASKEVQAELIEAARAEAAEGRFEDATHVLRRLIALAPSNAEAAIELGDAYSREQRWRKAWNWYSKAREADASNWRVRYELACVALEEGDSVSAAAMAREAVAIEPGSAEALSLLADLALEAGAEAEAGFWLKRLLIQKPELAQARLKLAWLDLREGRHQEAAEGFTQCLADESVREEALYHRGLVRLAQEDFLQAAADLQEASAIRESGDTQLALASAFMMAGELDRAERALKAAGTDGGTADFWHELASRRMERKETEGAARAYARAVEADPALAAGYFALQSLS